MSVVVCTAHDAGYMELADMTRPSVERYCARHGYKFVYDPNVTPDEKDACKARLYTEFYNSNQFGPDDLFMWIDTDAIIMNSAVKVEDLVAEAGAPHFLWSYDWNGPNSGVWIARFTSQALHFIMVYQYLAQAMQWGDNWAMNQVMTLPPFSSWVACVPGKKMNSGIYELYGIGPLAHKNEISNYEPGDFILHLAGVDNRTRKILLTQYAGLAT